MGVDTHVCGSLGVATLAHKHTVDEHDAVESRSCCSGHHVVASAAVYLGALLLGGYHVEQLATQQLAVAHHRGIEQTDEVAVGSATVVAHLRTSLGERHRTADTHHVLTDGGALLFELRRQPDVVLIANGDEVGGGAAHGREEVAVDALLLCVLIDTHLHPIGCTSGIVGEQLHGVVGRTVVLHYYLLRLQCLRKERVELLCKVPTRPVVCTHHHRYGSGLIHYV